MKKASLAGMAILIVLSLAFVGCNNDPQDVVVGNEPSSVKNFKAVAYPGLVLLTWDDITDPNVKGIITRSDGKKEEVIAQVGAVTTSGTTTTIGQGYYRDYGTGLQNGVTYTYKLTLGYDGVGKKKTASQKVKADIPAPGSTITTTITAADFEVKAFKTGGFSTDANDDKILNTVSVKMKNFDPRFDYSIIIYQNDDWETGDDYDPTEGTSLTTGTFNINYFYSLSQTATVSFNTGTTYDPDLKQRAVITYTVFTGFPYKVATSSDTKQGLNTIVLNLTK